MRSEVSRLQRRFGLTAVYVTHDQVEAMTLGDRVAVLHKARCSRSTAPVRSTSNRSTCSSAASAARHQ
jgi:multiple sugar transport system ATP-binding protein